MGETKELQLITVEENNGANSPGHTDLSNPTTVRRARNYNWWIGTAVYVFLRLGKESDLLTLTWTDVAWQVYAIGVVRLILEVSLLFSNVISVFGLANIPVLVLFFFNEKMDGLMAMAMLLAIWGFTSYVY
ncbi:hypothetical protein TIFTF001_012541 [Ficus carica]|uniref:Uncharacterized protein n=1 Tax=Ficus carica TaxID=3494 RepID=A0AA87ZW46_FICCA|nr:hypothetical protein TIFTF001_012541 [Ficus carica]